MKQNETVFQHESYLGVNLLEIARPLCYYQLVRGQTRRSLSVLYFAQNSASTGATWLKIP